MTRGRSSVSRAPSTWKLIQTIRSMRWSSTWDRAPRTADGLVEFSAPFVIIKPVDMARGNQKVLYGVNNRGNAIEISFQTFPPLSPGEGPEAGDGLFLHAWLHVRGCGLGR